jgi:O-antigen ligase
MKFSVSQLSVLGLSLLCLGWLAPSAMQLGSLLIVVGAVAGFRDFRAEAGRCPLLWLSLLMISYLLLHYFALEPQITRQKANKEIIAYLWLWCFPLVGYAIYRSNIAAEKWLLITAMALSLRILMHTDWLDLPTFVSQRQGFGLPMIGLGLYAGVVLLGLLIFLPRFSQRISNVRSWRMLLWSTLFLAAGFGWLLSMSRGAWLATIAGLVVMSLLVFWLHNPREIAGRQPRTFWVTLATLLTLLLIAGSVKMPDRVTKEAEVYGDLFSLDREVIPYSSIGVRVHMVIYGLQQWSEHPLIGWGPGSARSLLHADGELSHWPHFHSSYIQLLVEQGVIGLGMYALALALLIVGLWRAWRVGRLAAAMFVFLLSAWAMVLAWSLFDTRMVHVDERVLLLLLSGLSFSYLLPCRRSPEQQERS